MLGLQLPSQLRRKMRNVSAWVWCFAKYKLVFSIQWYYELHNVMPSHVGNWKHLWHGWDWKNIIWRFLKWSLKRVHSTAHHEASHLVRECERCDLYRVLNWTFLPKITDRKDATDTGVFCNDFPESQQRSQHCLEMKKHRLRFDIDELCKSRTF